MWCICAGVIQALAYIDYRFANIAILTLGSIILLENKYKQANFISPSWLYALGLLCTSSYWIIYPLHEMIGIPWHISILILLISFSLIACLWPCMFHLKKYYSAEYISIAWILTCSEYLRQYCFFTLPWTYIGYISMHIKPLAVLIPYCGVFPLTYLMVHIANACAEIYQQPKQTAYYYLTLGIIILGGYIIIPEPSTMKHEQIDIQLLQANLNTREKLQADTTIQKYAQLLNKVDTKNLILFPEASFHFDIYNDDNALAYIQEQFSDINAIVGLSYKYSRNHETYITMLATGNATGEYHKKYRVPFGETIPGLDSIYPLLSILFGKNIPFIISSMHTPTAIPISTTLNYKNTKFYPILCYEVFFPPISTHVQAATQANLISAENTWYADSNLHQMMQAAAKFHALQSLKPTILIMNRGPSTIYNKQGDILAQTKFNEQSVLKYKLNTNNSTIPYQSNYDSVIIIALLVIDWICFQCRKKMVYYEDKLFPKKYRKPSAQGMGTA